MLQFMLCSKETAMLFAGLRWEYETKLWHCMTVADVNTTMCGRRLLSVASGELPVFMGGKSSLIGHCCPRCRDLTT